jgi:GTP1/Obg family GTP-binding protein
MSQTSSSSSFKNIEPVPTGTDFLDIVLSRTQRRLPTVIRPGFKISRIRAFYARKVKFTQESFTEKLEAILTQFPRLDAIHPFHADLVHMPFSVLSLIPVQRVVRQRTLQDCAGTTFYSQTFD